MNDKFKNFVKVEDYFNKSDVYSKICKNNYMNHREIFDLLKGFIEKTFNKKPFNLLDLGCGEAFFMSQVLESTKVASYDAYDLAEESIKKAKINFSKINCSKNFHIADLSKDFLNSNDKTSYYDVIWSSFALHHLSLDDKKRFFQICKNKLKNNSFFMLIDFINDYGSRDECLIHYKESVEKKWIGLTKEDKEFVYDHVFRFDFPESFQTYNTIAKDTGFKNAEKIFQEDSWAYMIFHL